MRILGIDPGFARVGWAVIDTGKYIQSVDFGCIETLKTELPQNRLHQIHKAIRILCKKFRPEMMSVEDVFFAVNAKTAIGVGQSRGVILLSAAQEKVPVAHYSPLAVKRVITGNGKADKKQMIATVTKMLRLQIVPKLDDTADAIAIAMMHAYSTNLVKPRRSTA